MVPTQDFPDHAFRVATFNIRYDTPADGDRSWDHRKDRVASLLRFHRPDVVGLQEPLAHQYDFLRERLPEFDWNGVGRVDGAREGEFNPIAARSNQFAVADGGTHWLSEAPGEPGSMAWDASHPRLVTWVELRGPGGRSCYHFNTHFSHRSEHARVESAHLVRELVAEVADGTPALVTGDLNCVEGSEPYAVLTDRDGPGRQLHDAFRAAGEYHHGPHVTFNRFEGDPDRKIDYVFATEGVSVHQHGVVAECWEGPPSSDHMPVMADVSLD
ncbi:endonuclease/exonuclease/phosphatase family protein [Halobium salinum]|uniref:Endonuclease/exonuclease/phosphatase family protein n=1 Tax=Halobium salinum TaxID=1364940 RepID=A0ABD5PGK1_9EURY|nr:endonuclease/exonuclease/phosphatase family protein [Halobium salinum]